MGRMPAIPWLSGTDISLEKFWFLLTVRLGGWISEFTQSFQDFVDLSGVVAYAPFFLEILKSNVNLAWDNVFVVIHFKGKQLDCLKRLCCCSYEFSYIEIRLYWFPVAPKIEHNVNGHALPICRVNKCHFYSGYHTHPPNVIFLLTAQHTLHSKLACKLFVLYFKYGSWQNQNQIDALKREWIRYSNKRENWAPQERICPISFEIRKPHRSLSHSVGIVLYRFYGVTFTSTFWHVIEMA